MENANKFPVQKMCEVLEVSSSGYYKWEKTEDKIKEEKVNLDQSIERIFEFSRQTYGSPRIAKELKKENVFISERSVARRMKKLNITPKIKKKHKITTDSKHSEPVYKTNLEDTISQ